MFRLLAVHGCLLAAVIPQVALASWPPDGAPIPCGTPCRETNPQTAPDGAGGVFVVWGDARSGLAYDVYAHHLTASGDLANGWPHDGLPVCVSTASKSVNSIIGDGHGGFFVTWMDGRNQPTAFDIYAQHVRGDGTLAPGWPMNGVPVTQEPLNDQVSSIASDGNDGIFIAWWNAFSSNNVWAQHLGANGAAAPNWPSDGILTCNQPSGIYVSVIPDGTGGMIMAWRDWRRGGRISDDTFDVYGMRLSADGNPALGWPVNGLLLGPGQWIPILFSDSSGGFFMVSSDPSGFGPFDARYYVQHFTIDGQPDPRWPAGGVLVCSAPGDRAQMSAARDAAGGLVMDWYDYRSGGSNVYGARVLPDGTLAPGWPANGLLVSDPTNPYAFAFSIAPDSSGGAYMSWGTDGSTSQGYVQHVSGGGTVATGWPQYGTPLASTCGQFSPELVTDGAGGAIAVWEERDGTCSRLGLFAQHLLPNGFYPVAVLVSIANAEATPDQVVLTWQGPGASSLQATVERRILTSPWEPLGSAAPVGSDRLQYLDRSVSSGSRYAYRLRWLDSGQLLHSSETWVDVPQAELALEGLRPNPAAFELNAAFSLPSSALATLDLLDVSGRRIASREVGSLGPGNHTVRLNEAGPVPAGIYWLRLTEGARSLVARGVVIR